MTKEESIAVLKAHKQGLELAKDFESYKAQHLAFVGFLIEEMELDKARDDFILTWVVNMETKTNV